MTDPVVAGVLMGIGGTAAMDLWALLLARTGIAPFPNWAMPGRWLAGALGGTIWQGEIGARPPVRHELPLGWAFHYAVGVLYVVVFAVAAGSVWLAAPSFAPVWLFALATIAAGWFLLQPGMGLGWAASKTPNPWKVRGLGLTAHTAFGLGMWLVALAL